ncbi:MAG: glycosyl hydrolase family 25 lysozyme [Fibrobacteres bacterium]|nr:glycosyl hydrolase family 25 lysozyme [Fibrobacterota bacterium]
MDVSHHQSSVDWEAAKNEGIRFVYIKATEGVDWIDDRYRMHDQDARDHGLAVGAYHYFTFCADGGRQAAHFLAHMDLRSGDLPPAVDVEAGGNCTTNPDPDSLRKSLGEFNRIIAAGTGREPIIYTTQVFYWRYFPHGFGQSRFWIRNLLWCPGDAALSPFCQYAVAGIKGAAPGEQAEPVDQNAFHGNEAEFRRLLIPTASKD